LEYEAFLALKRQVTEAYRGKRNNSERAGYLKLSARSIAGLTSYIAGLVTLIYAGVNFNTLLFVHKLISKSDLPTYSQTVFLPILVGVLVLFDGSFIANLKRADSGVLYALGNIGWIYGVYLLYLKMRVPVNEIDAYRSIFYFIGAAVVLFIVGAILNEIPRRHLKERPR
jgi:uncharacterized membrane protein YeaQ/YmgE (transglycosylase-associated protein family)